MPKLRSMFCENWVTPSDALPPLAIAMHWAFEVHAVELCPNFTPLIALPPLAIAMHWAFEVHAVELCPNFTPLNALPPLAISMHWACGVHPTFLANAGFAVIVPSNVAVIIAAIAEAIITDACLCITLR